MTECVASQHAGRATETRLNTAQVRSVQTALSKLEERLRSAEAWLPGVEEHHILYRRCLALAPERRARLQAHIAEALGLIACLARTLDLEREEQNVASHIRAELSASWVNLCDIHSDRLHRYGSVDPALPTTLDPAVERLASLALDIAGLMDSDGNDQEG